MRKTRGDIKRRSLLDEQLFDPNVGRGDRQQYGLPNLPTAISVDSVTIGRTASGVYYVLDAGIDTLQLADYAVTEPKLAASSVTDDKLVDGAVTASKIYDQAVSGPKFADGTASVSGIWFWDGSSWAFEAWTDLSTFLALVDTPGSWGSPGEVVTVVASGDGLYFAPIGELVAAQGAGAVDAKYCVVQAADLASLSGMSTDDNALVVGDTATGSEANGLYTYNGSAWVRWTGTTRPGMLVQTYYDDASGTNASLWQLSNAETTYTVDTTPQNWSWIGGPQQFSVDDDAGHSLSTNRAIGIDLRSSDGSVVIGDPEIVTGAGGRRVQFDLTTTTVADTLSAAVGTLTNLSTTGSSTWNWLELQTTEIDDGGWTHSGGSPSSWTPANDGHHRVKLRVNLTQPGPAPAWVAANVEIGIDVSGTKYTVDVRWFGTAEPTKWLSDDILLDIADTDTVKFGLRYPGATAYMWPAVDIRVETQYVGL